MSLAQSAINALVLCRMVKMQQMRVSRYGTQLLQQVHAAVLNFNLEKQRTSKPLRPVDKSRPACFFQPTLPLLRAARRPA
jgi:hypothetical protein